VLVAEAAEDLHGGVALLGWRVFIGGEDGVDDGVKGAEDGGRGRLGAGIGLGLGLGEDLPTLRREW